MNKIYKLKLEIITNQIGLWPENVFPVILHKKLFWKKIQIDRKICLSKQYFDIHKKNFKKIINKLVLPHKSPIEISNRET